MTDANEAQLKRHSVLKVNIEYYVIFLLVVLLSVIGLIMVFSASTAVGERYFGDPYKFIKKQAIGWVISFIVLIIVSRINYKFYSKVSIFILLVCIGLLALVLIPGFSNEISGSRRWIDLWLFNIQPSEFTKIAIILYFSDLLNKRYINKRRFKNILWPGYILLILITFLIVLEPDFSTIIIIWAIVFILMFIGNVKLWQMISLGFVSFMITFSYLFLEEYRRQRIMAFFNSSSDYAGSNFQISQSLIALGSGNISGLGLGNSLQKYSYLPEAQTDFIFAIIGEEFGLIGTLAVVVLYILLIYFGIRVCLKTKDYMGRTIAAGIIGMIAIQTLMNIMVVVGLIPVTGCTLPFISFGTSSLLVSMLAIGILLNISKQNYYVKIKARQKE